MGNGYKTFEANSLGQQQLKACTSKQKHSSIDKTLSKEASHRCKAQTNRHTIYDNNGLACMPQKL